MQENADQNNSIYGHSLRSVRDLYMYKCSQKLKEAGQFLVFRYIILLSICFLEQFSRKLWCSDSAVNV